MATFHHPRIQKRWHQSWMLICIHMPWQTSVYFGQVLSNPHIPTWSTFQADSRPENEKLPAPYVLRSSWHGEGTGPMLGTSVRSGPGAAGGKNSRRWSFESDSWELEVYPHKPCGCREGNPKKCHSLDLMMAVVFLTRNRTPSLSILHLRKR